jgi:hypothetical protein
VTLESFNVQFFNTEKSAKVDKALKRIGVYTNRNIERFGIFYPKERKRLEKAGLKVVVVEYCVYNTFRYGIFVYERRKKEQKFSYTILGWTIEVKRN